MVTVTTWLKFQIQADKVRADIFSSAFFPAFLNPRPSPLKIDDETY
jgi:hypothetical protein